MVDQIRAVGVCVRVGELSKIPQKGVEQERGKGKQRFKRGGQRVGASKEGLEYPYEPRILFHRYEDYFPIFMIS